MTLFNADDYGITEAQAEHILDCAREGRLTGVSAMPNSPRLEACMEKLAGFPELHVAVHLNLTEGLCLSDPAAIPLLADEDGRFVPSFGRLLALSLGPKWRALIAQMETEFSAQIGRVLPLMGGRPLRLDGHQHIQMIPAVLQAVRNALREHGWTAEYVRFTREPLAPYMRHPSLWSSYRPVNLVKNLLLNALALFDGRTMREIGVRKNMAMGLVISGNLEYRLVSVLLPDFERIAQRRGQELELVMHPGWGVGPGEGIDRPGGMFEAFYLDPGRRREYDCLRQI